MFSIHALGASFYKEKEVALGLSMWLNCERPNFSSVIVQPQYRFKEVTLITMRKYRYKHFETNLFEIHLVEAITLCELSWEIER